MFLNIPKRTKELKRRVVYYLQLMNKRKKTAYLPTYGTSVQVTPSIMGVVNDFPKFSHVQAVCIII